jgi:K(+)-stimulated pyrophosphate-energized sodium pump
VRVPHLVIGNPDILVGVIIGAAVVFLFSGLAINAVGRAAGAVVFEVRRQFREHPGIMDYTEKPEYGRSSTSAPGTRCASWSRPACSPC